jgi:ATP-binding cassette subfamily F protein 3
MISVENLSVYYGARPILRDVSFKLGDSERVCLVGPNGAGKSTLLRSCAGEVTPDGGKIAIPNRATLGYLAQDSANHSELALFDEVMTVFGEAENALLEMRELEHKMADLDHHSKEFEKIADRYDFLQQEVIRLDAYAAESKAARVLAGLGFANDDLHRPFTSFSGGWRMRGELAKILLSSPDVLLLDEPTNYLDLETMLWLERYLIDLNKAMLFVSHERAFMDRLADRVIEVSPKGQYAIYKGNYTRYLETRDERRVLQQQAFENQQAKIKHMESFVARFRASARRSSQAQSRLKALDRMEVIEAPPSEMKSIHFKFPPSARSNKRIVELAGVTKRYGDGPTVLEKIDFIVERGDKIALVGLNGAGKSTLIKLMFGAEPATSGEVKIGEKTQMAYFAQHQDEDLSPENTVFEELATICPEGAGNMARDIAGAFLFRGEDVDKQTKVLSGGEKTRLRIAKMLIGGGNFLLLDEPTNHLDIGARATLVHALKQFDGAFVIVSHDRAFVDEIANKIYEVGDKKVKPFNGTFAEYAKKLESVENALADEAAGVAGSEGTKEAPKAPLKQSDAKTSAKNADNGAKGQPKAAPAPSDAVDPKEARKKLRALRKEFDELEETIQDLEGKQAKIDLSLADPKVYADGEAMAKLQRRRADATEKLEAAMERWDDRRRGNRGPGGVRVAPIRARAVGGRRKRAPRPKARVAAAGAGIGFSAPRGGGIAPRRWSTGCARAIRIGPRSTRGFFLRPSGSR